MVTSPLIDESNMKSERRSRRRREDGFTMAELLVTMLILTVVLVGLAALQISSVRQVTASQASAEATRLAERRLEYWRNVSLASLIPSPGTAWQIALNQRVTGTPQMVNVGASGEGNGRYTVREFIEQLTDPQAGNYFQVSVQVIWAAQRINRAATAGQEYAQRSVVLSTRRFR
jgi:prepilin-type N-terminal cleavage/methylation domain-containing protein